MAFAKSRKYKKKAYKGKSKKRMGMSYPDAHNYKLQATSSFLSASINGPATTGLVSIGSGTNNPPVAGPSGSNLWNMAGSINFSGGSSAPGVTTAVPYFPALANIYDRFRVNKIKVRIIPEVNIAVATGSSVLPTMKVVYDYDDAGISSVGALWGRRGKCFRLDKPHTFSFIPRVNYNTTTATSGTSPLLIQKCPWINTTNGGTVVMFGLKWAIKDFYTTSSAGTNNIVRFEITYYYSFKEQIQGSAVGVYGQATDYGFHPNPPVTDYYHLDSSGNILDSSGNVKFQNVDGNEVPVP